MRNLLAAAAIVIAGSGAGWAQSADSCGDVINDPAASCSSVLAPSAGGTVDSGATSLRGSSGAAIGSSGSVVDRITTDAIPDVPKPRGMAPLDVPTNVINQDKADRLGGSVTGPEGAREPFSNPGLSSGRSGISSPSIQ